MAELPRVLIPEKDAYWLITCPDGLQGIICGQCGTLSWHHVDVVQRYCRTCDRLHDRRTMQGFGRQEVG